VGHGKERIFNDRHVASDNTKAIGDNRSRSILREGSSSAWCTSSPLFGERNEPSISRSEFTLLVAFFHARLKICQRSAARLTAANISRLTPCPRN